MPKRILVILGHPRRASFCGALADAYAEGAKAGGREVRVISLGSLSFDPILHDGYAAVVRPLGFGHARAQADEAHDPWVQRGEACEDLELRHGEDEHA